MGRDYSKGACATCKKRKKKCDEAKPVCITCSRLLLDRSYESPQPRKKPVRKERGPDTGSPLTLVQTLRPIRFHDATEEAVVSRIPASADAFLSRLCSDQNRDLSIVWQLMFQDELVRNALVACFSLVMGSTQEHGQLNRSSYGNALGLLRSRIGDQSDDESSKTPILVAIQYFGLMDSTGPDTSDDYMKHWKALARLIAQTPRINVNASRRPAKNMYLLLTEALVYHTTLTLFSESVHVIRRLWRQAYVFETLKDINPRGSNQVESSPLLCGQYTVYELGFEATYLHRQPRQYIQVDQISRLEREIDYLRSGIDEDIGGIGPLQETDVLRSVYNKLYHHHADAVSICFHALRRASKSQVRKIDSLASKMMKRLADFPLHIMSYDGLVWPLAIHALALRHKSEFENLQAFCSSIKHTLDPGHSGRLQAVLDAVQQLLTNPAEHSSEREQPDVLRLPIGLTLLSKPGGVLS